MSLFEKGWVCLKGFVMVFLFGKGWVCLKGLQMVSLFEKGWVCLKKQTVRVSGWVFLTKTV